MLATSARRDRLDARIEQLAADSGWTSMVHRLGCLREISTLTGFALAVEIGDGARFDGTSIGTYLGLILRGTRVPAKSAQDHPYRKRPRPPAPGRSLPAPHAPPPTTSC